MKRSLPALPAPFPASFRAMLDQILQRSARIQGARRETARSRHRALVQSGTFAGHRRYSPGDDLRRIDWNAYARTGQMFIKVLTEEERRATTLLLDVSPSMLAGDVPRLVTALRLAAILGGLALVHLDGVLVHAAASESFAGKAAVGALLEHLARQVPAAIDPIAAVGALSRHRAPGKVHWISDFAEPALVERTLQRLRRLGFAVVGWLPTIAADFAIAASGWTTVVDPETGAELPLRIDRDLAAAMTHELQVLQRQQTRVFTNCGFPLQRFLVPTDAFAAAQWLEAGWSFRR